MVGGWREGWRNCVFRRGHNIQRRTDLLGRLDNIGGWRNHIGRGVRGRRPNIGRRWRRHSALAAATGRCLERCRSRDTLKTTGWGCKNRGVLFLVRVIIAGIRTSAPIARDVTAGAAEAVRQSDSLGPSGLEPPGAAQRFPRDARGDSGKLRVI